MTERSYACSTAGRKTRERITRAFKKTTAEEGVLLPPRIEGGLTGSRRVYSQQCH